MGGGSRIAHQHHTVAVSTGAPGDPAAAGGEQLVWHDPDSTAVARLALDPHTGDLLVFYRRSDGGSSDGYLLHDVDADTWQRLTSGQESVGRLVQQLANDPAHRAPTPPVSGDAQRLIDALRATASPAAAAGGQVLREGTRAAGRDLSADQAAAAAAATTRQPEPAVSYLDDPAAFQRAYDDARARRARGEPPVPYLTEDATGGLGARDGGRAFGVELEFDLPAGPDQAAARTAIAQELHAAGITADANIHGYHAGRGSTGYSDAANGWRLETDVSVTGGELVSPIMYDEPQTWTNLQQACEIIRRHGGQASVRAGSHVTVSTGNYGTDLANHNRLLRAFADHQDTLYRLATDPERGRHRYSHGSSYCTPNQVPATGYTSLDGPRHSQGGHHLGLNLQHSNGRSSDRAEFRLWDATLDPATIQTHIKISLGLAEAAHRGTTPARQQPEQFGGHRATVRTHGGRLTGQAWRTATEPFRGLVDRIFHRDVDRAQATALFAVNRWQSR